MSLSMRWGPFGVWGRDELEKDIKEVKKDVEEVKKDIVGMY